MYKVWVSYINLPDRYIENSTIKYHIFPNLMSDDDAVTESVKKINTNKRKLSFSNPENISKKNKKGYKKRDSNFS